MSTVTVSCAFLALVLAYIPAFVKNVRSIAVAGTAYNQEPRATFEKVVKELTEEEASFLRRALACHNNHMEGACAITVSRRSAAAVLQTRAARVAPHTTRGAALPDTNRAGSEPRHVRGRAQPS